MFSVEAKSQFEMHTHTHTCSPLVPLQSEEACEVNFASGLRVAQQNLRQQRGCVDCSADHSSEFIYSQIKIDKVRGEEEEEQQIQTVRAR